MEVVQSWLDAGGDVNAVVTDMSSMWHGGVCRGAETLLRVAVKYSWIEGIRYLLSRGAAAGA